jgi:hypothetical protein
LVTSIEQIGPNRIGRLQYSLKQRHVFHYWWRLW